MLALQAPLSFILYSIIRRNVCSLCAGRAFLSTPFYKEPNSIGIVFRSMDCGTSLERKAASHSSTFAQGGRRKKGLAAECDRTGSQRSD